MATKVTIERTTDETATEDLCRVIVWHTYEDGSLGISDIFEMNNGYGNAARMLMRLFVWNSTLGDDIDFSNHASVDIGQAKLPETIAERIFNALPKQTYSAQDERA